MSTSRTAFFEDNRVNGSKREFNRSQFMQFFSQLSLKDRSFWSGTPFNSKLRTVVFQNSWYGTINPFWVGYFKIRAPTITNIEAQALYERQLPVPLDRRPSQKSRARGRPVTRVSTERSASPRVPRPKTSKGSNVWIPRLNLPPDSDYTTMGQSNYVDGTQGVYDPSHVVSARRTTKVSVKTPNFKSLKKSQLPWNNYSHTYDVLQETPGTYTRRYKEGNTTVRVQGFIRGSYDTGQQADYHRQFMTYPNTTEAEALVKCLSRSKSMKVNLAQMYGERRQTVGLVINSLNRLVNLAGALKKGNIAAARRLISGTPGKDTVKSVSIWNRNGTHVIGKRFVHTRKGKTAGLQPVKTFANLWLEYQYGWRPLLSDIYGSCEEIANTFYAPKMLRVSATAHQDIDQKDNVDKWGFPHERVSRTIRNRSHVVFMFSEPTEWTNVLSRTGLTNPALLAWELMPYSFVIDWIVPVGDYLSNLDATVGLNFVKGSTTTRQTIDLTSRIVSHESPYHAHIISGSVVTRTRDTKSRRVYTSVPSVPLPTVKPSIGAERALSAISLLTQIFTRGKTTVK